MIKKRSYEYKELLIIQTYFRIIELSNKQTYVC